MKMILSFVRGMQSLVIDCTFTPETLFFRRMYNSIRRDVMSREGKGVVWNGHNEEHAIFFVMTKCLQLIQRRL